MKEYRITAPSGSHDPLPAYFYNSTEYLELVSKEENICSFFLLSPSSDFVLARLHFQCLNGVGKSHWRAPFGFLETSVLDTHLLSFFWEQVEKELGKLGVKEVRITSWPFSYNPLTSSFLWDFLLHNGFSEAYHDYNFHLPVTEKQAVQHFLKPERKRVRKCRKEGLVAARDQDISPSVVYDVLWHFRQQRNIPLTISKELLIKSLETCPDRYSVFVVKDQQKIVAISVCVEVNREILYHFCSASDVAYHLLSPSVLLYEAIYSHCQQIGYSQFDFGIASIQGIKQEGLFRFKQKLGGQVSKKPTFVKKI
jgi:hypothetical protein